MKTKLFLYTVALLTTDDIEACVFYDLDHNRIASIEEAQAFAIAQDVTHLSSSIVCEDSQALIGRTLVEFDITAVLQPVLRLGYPPSKRVVSLLRVNDEVTKIKGELCSG